MLFKTIVVILLLFILASLGFALVYMLKEPKTSTRMLKSLTWRIGLSLLLFALLIIGAELGWIEPHPSGFE